MALSRLFRTIAACFWLNLFLVSNSEAAAEDLTPKIALSDSIGSLKSKSFMFTLKLGFPLQCLSPGIAKEALAKKSLISLVKEVEWMG